MGTAFIHSHTLIFDGDLGRIGLVENKYIEQTEQISSQTNNTALIIILSAVVAALFTAIISFACKKIFHKEQEVKDVEPK